MRLSQLLFENLRCVRPMGVPRRERQNFNIFSGDPSVPRAAALRLLHQVVHFRSIFRAICSPVQSFVEAVRHFMLVLSWLGK